MRSKIVGTCPFLTEIRFAGAGAEFEGTHSILLALAANTKLDLQSLDLHGGVLRAESVDALVTVLQQSPHLLSLNIGDCQLGDEGMQQVCKALISNQFFLSSLDISANDLTDGCCESLRRLLNANIDNLLEINVENNELTDEGVETLLQAYARNAILERLCLSGNELGHGAAVALVQAWPHLENLDALIVEGNDFGVVDATSLRDTFGTVVVGAEDNEERDGQSDKGIEDEEIAAVDE